MQSVMAPWFDHQRFFLSCLPSTYISKATSLPLSKPPLVDRFIINQSWNATKKKTMIRHHLVVAIALKKTNKKSCNNNKKSNCTSIKRVIMTVVVEASLRHLNHVPDHMARLYFTGFWKLITRTLFPSLLHSNLMKVKTPKFDP